MFLTSGVLPFWSETDELGGPDNYEHIYLDAVKHATWGLRQFCIGLPIAVLNDEPYDVCMEYEEDVVFTWPGRPDRVENGCSLFHDEV